MLREAGGRVVIFTGAGMSTESGIPDFRGPGGIWSRMKPIYFQEFIASEPRRREAWTRTFSGVAGWTGAKPNAGHHCVTRWVAEGKVTGIITQNVDNLHQDSGAPEAQVIELHGNAGYALCLGCGLRHELADLRGPFVERGEIPVCRACGALVKTATISFGQPMPAAKLALAQAWARDCRLFLVLGSSLAVFPAAQLPLTAKAHGAQLAIVNREPTEQDAYADLVLHETIGDVLLEVSAALGSA
jgi:NAD-dependent deacetylase